MTTPTSNTSTITTIIIDPKTTIRNRRSFAATRELPLPWSRHGAVADSIL
jgi:hypothetical protein